MQVLAPDCLALPLESSINYSTPFLVNLEEACIQILPHLHSHKYPQCHRGTTYINERAKQLEYAEYVP